MSTVFLVPALAMGAGFFCAAPAAAPLGGVEVTHSAARFDAAFGGRTEVDVELSNTSGKTVAAWSYDVDGTYADGSVKTTTSAVDDITALLTPETRAKAFSSGTFRSTNVILPLGKLGDIPTKVETTLTMVVFDDDSAAGHAVSLGGLRRHMAAVENTLLDAVQAARAAPDPRAALKALIDKNPGQGMYMQLLPMFDHGPEALETVLSMHRTYRDLLLQHCELKPLP